MWRQATNAAGHLTLPETKNMSFINIYTQNVTELSVKTKSKYAVITIAIRLRYDYDPTTTYRAHLLSIRREQKNEHVNFLS